MLSTKLVIVMKKQGPCSQCLKITNNSNTKCSAIIECSCAVRTLEEKHEGHLKESVNYFMKGSVKDRDWIDMSDVSKWSDRKMIFQAKTVCLETGEQGAGLSVWKRGSVYDRRPKKLHIGTDLCSITCFFSSRGYKLTILN